VLHAIVARMESRRWHHIDGAAVAALPASPPLASLPSDWSVRSDASLVPRFVSATNTVQDSITQPCIVDRHT